MQTCLEQSPSSQNAGCGSAQQITACLITCYADFIVACTAIHGAIILGQEWYLCLSTALGANNRVHLTWATFGAATPHATRRAAARRATGRATTGLIHQALLLVKLLFSRCKYEVISAFTALQGFVNEIQLGTSLVICWYSSGSSISWRMSPVCLLPQAARDRMFWKITICQTEIG